MKRRRISARIFDAIWKTQKGLCNACGNPLSITAGSKREVGLNPAFANVDHVVPLSRGGSDDPSNLQLLCATCNRKKGNR